MVDNLSYSLLLRLFARTNQIVVQSELVYLRLISFFHLIPLPGIDRAPLFHVFGIDLGADPFAAADGLDDPFHRVWAGIDAKQVKISIRCAAGSATKSSSRISLGPFLRWGRSSMR